MTYINSTVSSEAAQSPCAEDPSVRILHRVHALDDFPIAERANVPTRRVAIVDTETTGTDPLRDEIIDLAVVVIEVDAFGEIVGIVDAKQALRDPNRPIPPAITRLTGICDEDVADQVIDLDQFERLLASADVRIAHNARFDIAFLERLMPGLAGRAWACSAFDFDWSEAGFDGAKLGHLLMQAGWFNDAHRAMADVVSLLHLLGHRLDTGQTMIGQLLDTAALPTVRVEATAAPFHLRELLKARGYRWDARNKVWWIERREEDCLEEERWYRREIMPDGPLPRMRPLTWNQRHR